MGAVTKIQEPESFEDYIRKEIAGGFLGNDLRPLRCRCGGASFSDKNIDRSEHGILEYDSICDSCCATVGHWAYGHWQA